MSDKILIDTSVIVDHLRGNIKPEIWLKTLEGRAPVVSPVTVHELRRGIVPGSRWEDEIASLTPPGSLICPPPTTEDWLSAADIIRFQFGKSRSKTELASLVMDTLICLAAKGLNAELWSGDRDFAPICSAIGVLLLDH